MFSENNLSMFQGIRSIILTVIDVQFNRKVCVGCLFWIGSFIINVLMFYFYII